MLDLWNQRNNSFIDTPNILQMMINSRNQISHFCLWHNFLILPFLFIYIINRITNNKEDSPFCIQFFMRIIKKKKTNNCYLCCYPITFQKFLTNCRTIYFLYCLIYFYKYSIDDGAFFSHYLLPSLSSDMIFISFPIKSCHLTPFFFFLI